MAAVERLAQEWDAFERDQGLGCPINIIVHKGELYAFRSFSTATTSMWVAVLVEGAARLPPGDTSSLSPGRSGST